MEGDRPASTYDVPVPVLHTERRDEAEEEEEDDDDEGDDAMNLLHKEIFDRAQGTKFRTFHSLKRMVSPSIIVIFMDMVVPTVNDDDGSQFLS